MKMVTSYQSVNSYSVAERINSDVNASVEYKTDLAQYGTPEHWVEGSSNLYFTNARAIAAVISTINAAIAAALEPTINPQTGTHRALNI